MKKSRILLGSIALGAFGASSAQAQTPAQQANTPVSATPPTTSELPAPPSPVPATNDSGLADIIVTAQRTSQSLQRVPIAVTAVSSADLARRQVTSSLNLEATVPNLTISQNGVSATPFLRGVGSNQNNPNDEASVATYVDGVYIPSVTGNIFKFNNIERIEVLKGPQGTLFGRNATGGVIQIVTRDPNHDPKLEASIGYGSYETIEASAYATAGVTPNLAADIAVSFDRNGKGYGRDINLNREIFLHDQLGVRSKILWKPTSTTEVRLSGDYNRLKSSGADFQLRQGVIGIDGVTSYPGKRRTSTEFANKNDNEVYGASFRLDQDLGIARFASISGYRHVVGDFHLDQDSTPLPVVQATINQFSRSFSQELQLLSPKSSKIEWLLGGYLFHAKYAYTPLTIAGFAAAPFSALDLYGQQITRSYSIFGQATFPVFDRTKLTLGLRYTFEKQSTRGSVVADGTVVLVPESVTRQEQDFKKLTWRAALDHQFSDEVLGYVSFNRGIKSGGFNMINVLTPGYRPEILDAYESGLKMQFFDRRVRLNVAAFIYKYKDVQVFNVTGGGAVLTTNAAAARVHGLDADLAFKASRDLTLSAGLGLLDGKYSNFPNATFTPASPLMGGQSVVNATGNRMIYAPKLGANAAIDFRVPTASGEFNLNTSVSYRSKVFVSAANRLAIPAYTVVNALVGWTSLDKRVGVQIWARNLLDKDYYINRTEQAFGDIQFLAPPRTVGVTLNLKTR